MFIKRFVSVSTLGISVLIVCLGAADPIKKALVGFNFIYLEYRKW